MRQLKYTEQKLLKHTDFLKWDVDRSLKENEIMRKYYVQKREDYVLYAKLARTFREKAEELSNMDPKDPFRIEQSGRLIEKLYAAGLISMKWNLILCGKVSPAAFCRRRLPCVLIKNKMCPNLKTAVTLVEQGHIRVGAEVVKDPAFLVTRALEDTVTWVDSSAIKKRILTYKEQRDDFLLENC